MPNLDSTFNLLGFALSDCAIETDKNTARYLRAVHRTALELAIPNHFGTEVGGFWLMLDQLEELRKLPDFYSIKEGPLVARTVEAYIAAQLHGLSDMLKSLSDYKRL